MLTGLPPWYSRDRQKMFASIRNDPLVIPNYVAPEIQSLIIGLLDKNPKSRLGGRGRDAIEIREHSIFRYVGWDQLYEKRVIPPWKPGDPSNSKKKDTTTKSNATTGNNGTTNSISTGKSSMLNFTPDTSNFEDTFTNMPVMSVGSEVSFFFLLFLQN
jgi:serine/threonine protein kinase